MPVYMEKDMLLMWWCTQCCVDVHKTELYIWIIQIIADNSERHVSVFL